MPWTYGDFRVISSPAKILTGLGPHCQPVCPNCARAQPSCRFKTKDNLSPGEVSLLRQLWDTLRPGGVLLGDRLMSGWIGKHLLKERGVDTVSRLSSHRGANFRRGIRLGKDGRIAIANRSAWTETPTLMNPSQIRAITPI